MSTAFKSPIVDPQLPTLEMVLDCGELRRGLAKVVPEQWGGIEDVATEVLQYHRASRCTMNFRLQTTTGPRELIGKVYREDRQDVYRVMRRISEDGFGPQAEFSIPKPIAFIPHLQLLVLEKVEGVLSTQIFLNGNAQEIVRAAGRCALWLANFHSNGPLFGQGFVLTRDLLEAWVSRLAKRANPLVGKAAMLSERLETCRPTEITTKAVPSHGTYCHYQIIINENRIVALDWDGYCVADAALDVARFLVILGQLAFVSKGSFSALSTAGQCFYETYRAASKYQVSERLPFFRAALCLKHAKDFVKRDHIRLEFAEAMIDEGLRILEDEI